MIRCDKLLTRTYYLLKHFVEILLQLQRAGRGVNLPRKKKICSSQSLRILKSILVYVGH